MMLEESRKRIASSPGIGGTAGRQPVLMTIFLPLISRAAALLQLHDDALRVPESRLAEDQFDIGGFLERLLNVMAEALDHAALALVHPTHVHRHGSGADAVVFRAPSEISDAGAGHHGLVGVQPTLMQVPPTCSRSITTTFRPHERAQSPGFGGCPVPMMTVSN